MFKQGKAEPQVCSEGYEHVLSYNRRKSYKRNDIILLEGTIATMAQVVISGWVAYYTTTEEGSVRIACLVGPKRAFAVGETIDELPIPMSVKALTDCEVSLSTRAEVLQTLKTNELLRVQIIKGISYRCRSLIEAQKNYSSLIKPQDKLTNFFSNLLLSSSWEMEDGWIVLPVGLTHEIIADAIDTSRITVTRLLTQYAREDLVKKGKNGHYYIKSEFIK